MEPALSHLNLFPFHNFVILRWISLTKPTSDVIALWRHWSSLRFRRANKKDIFDLFLRKFDPLNVAGHRPDLQKAHPWRWRVF